MIRLDPDELRAFASRDWASPERSARQARAALSPAEKSRLAVALYESAKKTRPDWPTDADRKADLDTHLRVHALLDRAAHVGRR